VIFRRQFLWLVALLLVVAVVEALSFAAAKMLLPTGLLVARPDLTGYAKYLQERDQVLGWPSPAVFGTGEYDVSGSRVVPAFPDDSHSSCVALFGDSFTWGDEVEPEHAYGNVLAELLDCRVANYGVGGYGTDQAAIRFMQVVDDDAPVVILGHFSENIIRNINQLRDFIVGGRFGFKPRFVLRYGELSQIPLPSLSAEEYRDVIDRAADLLPHEYFRPGTWGAAGVMQFPYTRAIAHTVLHYRVVSAVQGIRPTYAPFYQPDHPSRALDITVKMLARAEAFAVDRKQRFVVLFIPDFHDLESVRLGNQAAYAPLRELLAAEGIELIDAADYFVARYGEADFCELFVTCGASHFNPAGYRMLAEAVHEVLKSGEMPASRAQTTEPDIRSDESGHR